MPYHAAPTSRCNAPAAEGTDRRTGGGTRPRASLAGQTWRTGRRNDGRMRRRTGGGGMQEDEGGRRREERGKRAMLPLGLDLFLSFSLFLYVYRPRVFGPRECRGTPSRERRTRGRGEEGIGRGLALWAPQGLPLPRSRSVPPRRPLDERTNERTADRWPSVYASCY